MNSITSNTKHYDKLSRFLFDHHAVRGELVNVSQTYQHILANHHYPLAVQNLLGELLVVTCLLTATLKFEGEIAVQLQGDGALNLAVINGNHQQQMRGIAKVNAEIKPHTSLKEMMGNGYLVITITPKNGKRYQGIVELNADTVAGCIENYFKQSQQLPTRLLIKTRVEQHSVVAAGMLLQVLPAGKQVDNENVHSDKTNSDKTNSKSVDESFELLTVLAETIKAEELFTLPANEILYRLYHQETIRLFDADRIEFKCRCSRQRCVESLITLPTNEVDQILAEEGKIDMHCDYCGSHYLFDKHDIANLNQHQNKNILH